MGNNNIVVQTSTRLTLFLGKIVDTPETHQRGLSTSSTGKISSVQIEFNWPQKC